MTSLSEDELLNTADAEVLSDLDTNSPPVKAQSLIGKSVANMALRGVSMLARFLLMLALAYYLSPDDVGIFTLMYGSTTLGMLLLGLRFDVYSTRAICARDRTNAAVIIRDQFVFHLIVYLAVLPLMLTVFAAGILPWSLIGWFYALLVLEHVGQECNRIFVALGQPLRATFVFFLRSGAWTVLFLPLLIAPSFRSLDTLWVLWAAGGVSSLLCSGFWMRTLGWRVALKEKVDWSWIKRGLKPAAAYTVAIGSTMLISSADRYFLKATWGDKYVGVYGFYSSLTNFVPTFAETGIISILLPTLLAATASKDWDAYRRTLSRLTKGVWVIVIGSCALSALVAPVVLMMVNKEPIYAQHLPAFAMLVGSAAIVTLSTIPGNALYANHRDRVIAKWSVIGLAVAIACYAAFTPRYGIYGVSIGSLASSTVLLFGKWYESRQLPNR